MLCQVTLQSNIMLQACVAIQLLAEADSKMSTEFVNTECHLCLFEILENDDAPGKDTCLS